jgi:hypothetical protein
MTYYIGKEKNNNILVEIDNKKSLERNINEKKPIEADIYWYERTIQQGGNIDKILSKCSTYHQITHNNNSIKIYPRYIKSDNNPDIKFKISTHNWSKDNCYYFNREHFN